MISKKPCPDCKGYLPHGPHEPNCERALIIEALKNVEVITKVD